MAFARLTGVASIGLAVTLAVFLPDIGGAAYAGLAGWTGAVLLAIGVWFGEETAVVISAVAFVAKVIILSALTGPTDPPVWTQALILVLMVELASLSIESRVRPRPVASSLGRLGIAALLAMIISVSLESVVYGSDSSGTLLRIGALAAAVFLIGWLTIAWRRATD